MGSINPSPYKLQTWDPQVLNGSVTGAGLPAGTRGYVERLAMNFAPWHLGLRQLHWGRFCGERHSVVWIRWEGAHTQQFVMVDGVRHLGQVMLPEVLSPPVRLTLREERVLVDEPLSQGALAQVTATLPRWLPGLRGLRHFLQGIERKSLAVGHLADARGLPVDEGWAIFETVRWPA